ncbi:MAG: arylsulfatase [Saprospiraceae bacterium]|nr:arylsulfatase [Saprospiraceae bacterium]
MRIIFLFLTTLVFVSCTQTPATSDDTDTRPNILVLMADDLGYADLGCYGGDIETPNIDQLAAEGLRFSRYHTSPLCAPTRAMFLSGNDNHIAGMGIQSTRPRGTGYEGRLTDRIATIPELLKTAGYHTYMTGKWHLGEDSTSYPYARGFDRSFVNLLGAGNHYDDQGLFARHPKSPYVEDNRPATWPDGAYSTDFFTDKLISYIEENRGDDAPFFAFAAYTSPHWPLQVDTSHWHKYIGRYDDGYESLKARRLESLKQAGMIPQSAVLPPNHERVKPWGSLSAEQRRHEARKMELYAGMVDNLDHNVGRIVAYLKETGQYENTLIVFLSDNGAAAEDFYHDPSRTFIREHFNEDYETMGGPRSFISYGPQWAEAGSAPFKYFKGLTTQGGLVAPMVLKGPTAGKQGVILHTFVTVLDLAPTFYQLAGVEYPEIYNGRAVHPLRGKSLLPVLQGETETLHGADDVFAFEHDNAAMLRRGDWKIVNLDKPLDEANFALYNVSQDLAEIRNVRDSEPEIFDELLAAWRQFADEAYVQVPSPGW